MSKGQGRRGREAKSVIRHKKRPDDAQQSAGPKKQHDLTAADLADRYGLPGSYIHRCKKLREIAVKRGKYLFYPYEEVLKWEAYRKQLNRGFMIENFIRLRVEKGHLPVSLSPLKLDIAE